MGVKIRVDSIDRDVALVIDQSLSPAAQSREFAAGAKVLLDEADETNRQALGNVPENITSVDGRAGAALGSVSPTGVIVREYNLVIEALLFIDDQLRVYSPLGQKPDKRPGHPGFYRGSHALFADGEEVNFNGTMTAGQVPEAEEYVFLSLAPYARKVEQRHTVYEMVAAKGSSRFGNIAKIVFGWRSPLLDYVPGGANRAARAAQRRMPAKQAAKHIERSTRVPAIVVTMGR